MKKMLLILAVSFLFFTQTNATNKIEGVKFIPELINELCANVEVFIGECPDGSTFISAVSVEFYDCESLQTLAYAVGYIDSFEDSCN